MRFPEFSGEWEKERLSEIADLYKGIGISKEQLSDNGEPCILYGELYTKYKSETIKEAVSRTNINNSKLVRSKANDVIIPCSGETSEDIATARCVLNGNILLGGDLNIIRLHSYDGSFMSYQLNGKRKYDIAKVAQGVSVVHLYGEHLRGIRTFNPCLEEQKKIACFINLLDERIETQKKIIDKYESLIKGLIDKLINSSLRFPIMNFASLYTKAAEGGTPSTSNINFYLNGKIPFIKIEDLNNKYLMTHKDNITELGLKKSSTWIIPAGSLIYSNGATIGAISISTYPVCTKQGILGIIPNKSIDIEYFYYLMISKYFRKEITKIITEGTMKIAYLKDINKILCPVPNINEQKKIVKTLSSISQKIKLEQGIISKLHFQKKYLLYQMFI